MLELLVDRFPYWMSGILLAVGFYGMTAKRSLVKKLIGLNIAQSAVVLFYVGNSLKGNSTVPVLLKEHLRGEVDASIYVNPLPHVLMLTAIVVGVAITGVAIAFLVRIQGEFGTTDEDEILEQARPR
ncbi:MAG: NADH-quinone oxidoreductase subunit J [SAR202 cluster bacterium]|nr:NADH-quinone oxidoreductase subunit J [SAR202 cluster bacterium]